jgi:hydroxymethylpyrimidine pyrophosphatase-like HAD family hydrolase
MAFGDGGNDVSMLQYVEVSVAMGNADDPQVLGAASHIAPPVDDDGIARFLNSFFLHL